MPKARNGETTSSYGPLMRRIGVNPGVASVVCSPANVTVTVGGMAAFYSVVLRCSIAPEQAVSVSPVNLPTGLRILPTLHVFTVENWKEPQYFRVSAVNGVSEELRGSAAVIEHTTSSLDPRFHGRRVLHFPNSIQAHVSPRDGYFLFTTGRMAATTSQQLPLDQIYHQFTEIELRRSALGNRPLVARCSSLVPMAAGAKAAVAAVEAANQATAQFQSRRKLSAANVAVEELTTATRTSLDHSNALVKLTAYGDKTLALYNDGELLMLGIGDDTSCIHESGTDAALSRMLLDVACGDRHVVGASEQGYLLTWGDICDFRRSTKLSSNEKETRAPRIIQSLLHKRIVQVACGSGHSFALAEDGDVFSWGIGRSGALGHGLNAHEQTFDTVTCPMEVLALKGRRVVQIACGEMHSVALLLTGELLTCGNRENGRLGRSIDKTDECSSWFAPVIFPQGVKCTYVACGAAHTLVLGGPHNLYAFGWNSSGQLGVGDCRDRFVPTRVVYFDAVSDTLQPLTISSVAAGKQHSLALASDGRLFAWGSDEMGQCGLSSCPQIYTLPHLVTSLVGLRVTQLAAGEAHSAVLTSQNQRHLETLEQSHPIQYAQLVEHYADSVNDDTQRRAEVLKRARRQQLARAAAARRRKPPVDPVTEALAKMMALQALVDQDEALDAKYLRPQTARAGNVKERVRCSSASMVRQARLAVLQAPLATVTTSLIKSTAALSPKPSALIHKRPSSAAAGTRRQKTRNEGQQQITMTLLNQNTKTLPTRFQAFPPSRPRSAPCRSVVKTVNESAIGSCK